MRCRSSLFRIRWEHLSRSQTPLKPSKSRKSGNGCKSTVSRRIPLIFGSLFGLYFFEGFFNKSYVDFWILRAFSMIHQSKIMSSYRRKLIRTWTHQSNSWSFLPSRWSYPSVSWSTHGFYWPASPCFHQWDIVIINWDSAENSRSEVSQQRVSNTLRYRIWGSTQTSLTLFPCSSEWSREIKVFKTLVTETKK